MAYAGFDRADCPDLALMQRLKAETNLEWCGFYLPAPSQSGVTWRGKRAALVGQGWGLAPIFVGQQVMGPGSHLVTTTQGAADGERAAAAMAAEGFPPGSSCFLDTENGPPLQAQQKGYIGAFIDAIEARGFKGGVYCSFLLAGEVAALRPNARLWVFHVRTVSPHLVAGAAFPDPETSTSGYFGAAIWQRDDESRLVMFGDLAVDLDVAAARDPGAPDAAAATTAAAPASPAVSAPPDAHDAVAWTKWLQAKLNARGANPPLEEDGDFGELTRRAVANDLTRAA